MSKTKSFIDVICDGIIEGKADGEFDTIHRAILYRQKLLAQETSKSLKAGDRVVFMELVKPKVLRGIGATVQGVDPERGTVLVNIDDDWRAGNRRGRRNQRVSARLVRKEP